MSPTSLPALRLDVTNVRPDDLAPAVRWIQAGGIVAFPTETFYGLAVDPRNRSAVRALVDLKGRDEGRALPLVADSAAQVESVCGPMAGATAALAAAFWPGALSLLMEAPASFATAVDAGSGTIAVRVPDHIVARALAAGVGCLVTATSANRSGDRPASTAAGLGAIADDPRVFVIDGGPTPGLRPSTVVDARTSPPTLVRDGLVRWSRVLESLEK
jgi:L-threonylcarbamoyladenylate synthase